MRLISWISSNNNCQTRIEAGLVVAPTSCSSHDTYLTVFKVSYSSDKYLDPRIITIAIGSVSNIVLIAYLSSVPVNALYCCVSLVMAARRRNSFVQIASNPLEGGASASIAGPTVESLADASPISGEEVAGLIAKLKGMSDNESRLSHVESIKKPFLFSSEQMLLICEITPSIKTKLAFIAQLGPRLTDPKAKHNAVLDIFQYAEQKQEVEAVLKARSQHILSTSSPAGSGLGMIMSGRGGRGRGAGAGRGPVMAGRGGPARGAAGGGRGRAAPRLSILSSAPGPMIVEEDADKPPTAPVRSRSPSPIVPAESDRKPFSAAVVESALGIAKHVAVAMSSSKLDDNDAEEGSTTSPSPEILGNLGGYMKPPAVPIAGDDSDVEDDETVRKRRAMSMKTKSKRMSMVPLSLDSTNTFIFIFNFTLQCSNYFLFILL
jgi:hypothetical protein